MRIEISEGDHWTRAGDTAVAGSAFFDDEYVSEEELADRVSRTESAEELKRILSRANGFFSVIHRTEDEIHAAVDHVRSWPVYYAVSDDVYVSDSAEWIHENGAHRGYDPVAGTEYLFTGFVTGRDTLSRDVKQVRAGELVTLRSDRSGSNVCREQYYSYAPGETSRAAEESDLDEALAESVGRLIEYADGRPILLGLSGGYDSRAIALMLHRLGYDETITFTSHLATGGSKEMPVAKSIARDLGFEHIEMTSDRSDYRPIEGTEQAELVEKVGYLSEYPSINKVVQRRKLVEAGVDPSDVVLVLGHALSGAGTFLPERIRDEHLFGREEFFDLLWALQYSHWETPNEPRWRDLLEGRVLKRLPVDLYSVGNVEAAPDAASGFETWYWQERVPKYIVIRREYKHLGFDVWYPLLDRTLCSFFEGLNYSEKVDKRFLKKYVRQLDLQIRGEKSDLAGRTDRRPSLRDRAWDRMVDTVYALPDPATRFIRRANDEYRGGDPYEQDPRYRIVPKEEFDSISFPHVSQHELHRPLLLLYLYKRGYFDFPTETEFDRALRGAYS